MPFFAFLAGVGSAAGAFILISGFTAAISAPQEASVAALAAAVAVIPYVLFRAVQLVFSSGDNRRFREAVLDRLDAIERI